MSNSRIPGRNFLFVPGPTNLPDRVQRAMMVASEDHRSPTFPDLVKPLFPQLKKVFETEKGHAFIFPASGTGGWEAAITNTLSPGDKVLAQRFGQFSHLWIDLCNRLGLEVIKQERPWGTGNDPELIEETLKADKNHEIKAVLATHNETATGVTSDIGAVRKAIDAAKHPALLFVDGVSSVASLPFHMDKWGVDVIVSGSQKGFMLPAGLLLMAASEKAIEAGKHNKSRRAYFEFQDMIKNNAQRLLPLYAVDPAAARPQGSARDPVRRGSRPGLQAPPSPRRGRARRGQGLGPHDLRQGAEVEFGHGHRDRRAGRF